MQHFLVLAIISNTEREEKKFHSNPLETRFVLPNYFMAEVKKKLKFLDISKEERENKRK